jgi:hypothetical protein
MEISVNKIAPALAITALLANFTNGAIAHPTSSQSAHVSSTSVTAPTTPTTPAVDKEQQNTISSDATKTFWGNAQRNGQ